MGKYQKNIEAARRISVVQYLETYHPGELVRKTDKEYCTKTHSSLVITPANGLFHWFSQSKGGNNALDYLVKVEGIQLEKKVYYEKEPAGKALLGLLGLALNSEKPVPIGYFKGMELQIQHLPFGNEYHARLAGSGTYSTQLGADVLGNLTRLSNLANGIEPSIEKTRNMQIQLEQQLASAEEEVKRPFPQATELTEKSKRLAVLEGLLNMNDKDIVTDTEPEQQCQTDNRQRGQEER